MMTIFTMAFAAVMFSGMVLCMAMFLKHVVNSIPEMTNMSHSVSLSKVRIEHTIYIIYICESL